MGAGIAEDMQQILAVTFLADIAHARRDPSRIEAELAGAGGAQEVEEFVGFCSGAHGTILSIRLGRYECSDSQMAGKRIRLSRHKSLRHFYVALGRIVSVFISRSLGCRHRLTGRES